jgi:biotin transport system substrate-specific component
MSNLSSPAVVSFPAPSRVLADVLPGTYVRDVLLVLSGAALTALCAQISIHVPGSPVPITAQTFAVVIAGAGLGAWRGAASQLLYLVAGLVLPIYASGAHGGTVVWGASGGYLFGFILAAWIVGFAAEHGADRRPVVAFVTFSLGQLAIYAIGVPWLKVAAGMSWGTAVHAGFTIFILGGVVKAVLAGTVMPTAWMFHRSLSNQR